jgi:hypothetical protein
MSDELRPINVLKIPRRRSTGLTFGWEHRPITLDGVPITTLQNLKYVMNSRQWGTVTLDIVCKIEFEDFDD